MAKQRFLEKNYRQNPWFRQLCRAFLSCKTEAQLADLWRDVATLAELQALSERLEVASLIAEGRTYREVTQKTGASTTTVTRVASFLREGSGGYRRVVKKHHRNQSSPAS
ncbi:DNA-binding transcriptional regulator [Candidatus Uhrbacteria bacterium CG10_big_fil_rev_8_21_14_0_10_48_11]|uniref:DNA-binding transcriptional regulator n=1 Tax=Candidatus Uhrbacteria bacterium CG10_big_fil_rev_8_21_14_0_10_48_11 TaxID=1975037 RepID=A0A2M8LEZ9_9BACT|nr:MAG: DNA-binding transcriptional regulator [Candidatus Uhrbacteria bacterium CG10_big_fil_rev_8_21_14_0_10_48_11]